MSTDAKLLDRITKLLRLATNNPSEEEARTAALQAAKLIVEHKFVIGREAPRATAPSPSPRPPSNADIVELLRRQAEATRRQYEAQQAGYDEWMRQQERRARASRPPDRTPDDGSWWRKVWTSDKTTP